MPRASYYVNAGNPLQTELLPAHQLDLEFPYAGHRSAESVQLRNSVFLKLLFLDLGLAIPFSTIGAFSVTYVTVMFATYVIFSAVQAARDGAAREVIPLFCVGAACLFCLYAFNPAASFWMLVIAMLMGRFMFRFGVHWSHRCTTSPLPRQEARIIRERWKGYLRVISLLPPSAALIAIIFDSTSLFVMLLATCCAVQLLLFCRSRTALVAVKQAITSWCAYNNNDVVAPGIFQSPAGTAHNRRVNLLGNAAIVAWCCVMMSLQTAIPEMGGPFLPFLIFPGLFFAIVPAVMLAPLLQEALRCRKEIDSEPHWQQVTAELNDTPNPISRNNYFMGTLDSDGSPLLLSRSVFNEHAHFLGSSGSGKTARGLCPWIERTIWLGMCSLIVIDLKADTLELLSTVISALKDLQRRTGQVMPLKVFSSQNNLATHGFNPFLAEFWQDFNLYQRTDILCAALGLIYGADFGAAYYSSTNAAVLFETLRMFPEIRSFKELAERCHYVISNPKKTKLLPESAKNADHLYAQLVRLADFEQLQVAPGSIYPDEVVEQAIDLADMFRRPQLLYVHLSASLAAGSAPAIARLFTYMLLTASTQTDRQCPVYLVIDEFQRMVAQNLEYLLQLARSMGVGVILSNQSMADLKSDRRDLTPIIEANCRFRQWFDAPSSVDRALLKDVAGETIEELGGWSVGNSANGTTSSQSGSEVILPCLSTNEILDAGGHPKKSIIRLSRGDGYSQHAGLPIVIRSGFHISASEYERRKSMPWPEASRGMFVPAVLLKKSLQHELLNRPSMIREVDGIVLPQNDGSTLSPNDLFDGLVRPPEKKRRRTKDKE